VTATEELTRESHEYENRPLDLDAFDYGHGYVNPGLQIHGQDINDQKTDRVRDFQTSPAARFTCKATAGRT